MSIFETAVSLAKDAGTRRAAARVTRPCTTEGLYSFAAGKSQWPMCSLAFLGLSPLEIDNVELCACRI